MTLDNLTTLLTSNLTCYRRYYESTFDTGSRNNILAMAAGFAEGIEAVAQETLSREDAEALHEIWAQWARETAGVED